MTIHFTTMWFYHSISLYTVSLTCGKLNIIFCTFMNNMWYTKKSPNIVNLVNLLSMCYRIVNCSVLKHISVYSSQRLKYYLYAFCQQVHMLVSINSAYAWLVPDIYLHAKFTLNWHWEILTLWMYVWIDGQCFRLDITDIAHINNKSAYFNMKHDRGSLGSLMNHFRLIIL